MLPENYRKTVEFIKAFNPNLDELVVINALNAKLFSMFSLKHLFLKQNASARPTIVNYYGLSFAPSGYGKDKIIYDLNNYIFPEINEAIRKRYDELYQDEMNKVEVGVALLGLGDKAKEARLRLEQDRVRKLKIEISKGTEQGLFADCATIQLYKEGSVFVTIPELGLFFDNPTQSDDLFINAIISGYEGSFKSSSIKSENNNTSVSNIPINALFYSDSDSLVSGEGSKKLDSIFNAGLIRRAFIAYQPLDKLVINKDYKKGMQELYNLAEYTLKPFYNDIFNKTKSNIFALTEEAEEAYFSYKIANEEKYNELIGKVDSIIAKELMGRHWKMLKLSVLMALLNHAGDSLINVSDIKQAIYISDRFGESLGKFLKAEVKNDADKLFNFLYENINNFMTNKDIRAQRFADTRQYTNWIKENFPFMEEMAESKGLEFVSTVYGVKNNGTAFGVLDPKTHKAVLMNEKEVEGDPEKVKKIYKIVKNNKIESPTEFIDKAI